MKNLLKNNWRIIILELFVLAVFCVFYGKFGDIFVDSFREAYIPWQMNEGQSLYKDIFCIYPPLAYMVNALLFKVFGTSLNILYLAGLFCTMGILYLTYKISDKFLPEYLTFGSCLFLVSGLVVSPNVFNSFFPYSYGMLYGLLFILGSVYCLITKKYPLAYFLYSIAICFKYEFVFLLPLLIVVSKTTDWKKNCAALFLLPAIVLGILLISGTGLQNIKTSLELVLLMGQTKTLHFFYSSMGLVFRWEHLPLYGINFFKFILPINWNLYQEVIMWIFPLISILFILRFRQLNSGQKIFIAASFLISIKVFFALTLQSYGVYFIPFALISLGILTPDKIKKYLAALFIIWALIIGFQNCKALIGKDFSELRIIAEYISNTPESSTVAVYPEGLGINFISRRKSDSKFYSLIPLYVETFGEDVIINRLNRNKPQYIIINNFDTSAYYYKTFGIDYAKNILEWIRKNYSLDRKFEKLHKFEVYKLNP